VAPLAELRLSEPLELVAVGAGALVVLDTVLPFGWTWGLVLRGGGTGGGTMAALADEAALLLMAPLAWLLEWSLSSAGGPARVRELGSSSKFMLLVIRACCC